MLIFFLIQFSQFSQLHDFALFADAQSNIYSFCIIKIANITSNFEWNSVVDLQFPLWKRLTIYVATRHHAFQSAKAFSLAENAVLPDS